MYELRKLPFISGLILLLIALAAEAAFSLPGPKPIGYGITSLLPVDGVLMMSMCWIFLTIFVPGRVQGKLQGVISLVIGVALAVASVVLIGVVISTLITMLMMVAAVPVGTLIYVLIWGSFHTATAGWVLGLSLALKILFAALLVLANQQFLKVKSMIALVVTSIALNILVVFFQNSPLIRPTAQFAAIGDAAAAIVGALAGMTWAVATIVASAASVLKLIPTKPPGVS